MDNRQKYIGGSDAAALLGLSRWKTPLELWMEKTGRLLPEIIDTEAANLGIELEDYIARRFARVTGLKVRRNNRTIYHPTYNFLAANIDREIVGEDAILECKTCSAWKSKAWADEEIPLDYIIQVNHYLMVTGAKIGYIACLIGNEKFVWRKIVRDENTLKVLLEKELNFWNNCVQTDTPPLVITKDDNDNLNRLYPTATNKEPIILDDDATKIIESIQGLKADLMSIKDTIAKQENELKMMLKDNEIGKAGDYQISWKEQSSKRIDVERLKTEQAEIYKQYLNESKFRVLRINQTLKKGE